MLHGVERKMVQFFLKCFPSCWFPSIFSAALFSACLVSNPRSDQIYFTLAYEACVGTLLLGCFLSICQWSSGPFCHWSSNQICTENLKGNVEVYVTWTNSCRSAGVSWKSCQQAISVFPGFQTVSLSPCWKRPWAIGKPQLPRSITWAASESSHQGSLTWVL